MNKKFEILEHTADLKMKVWGNTLPELFKNTMEGMMQILSKKTKFEIKSQIFHPADARRGKKFKIKVESADAAALLIDFLNEVLYQAQVNKEVYVDVEFKKFSEKELEAELFGSPTSEFDEDIKAATYHGAEIKKTPEGVFETTVLFDI